MSSVTTKQTTSRTKTQRPRKGNLFTKVPFRIELDVLFALVLLLLVASATVEEFAHEWLGIAAFVLFILHQIQHISWWKVLLRGRYSPVRILNTFCLICLAVCFLGLFASSLVLSQHVFAGLPFSHGSAWARTSHMLFSYWAFILAFFHAGLSITKRSKTHRTAKEMLSFLVCIGLVILGYLCAINLDLFDYLALQSLFVFANPGLSLPERALPYLFVGLGMFCLAVLIRKLLRLAALTNTRT